jgi:PAS domain S-box-containing protein
MKREIELILDSTHDAMIAVDREGIITLYNAAAGKLTQKSSEDVIGKHITEVVETTRLPYILTTGESELNRKQMLGETEIVTNRMPVRNERGEIIGAIAVFRDITEVHALAEEITNLREVQSMLEAILNATQDAISVVNHDGVGWLINPAYTRLTGYTEKDIIGKPSTVDLAEGDSVHLKVLETREPVKGMYHRVGPNRKEVMTEAAPIIVDGELRGSVAVIHDLTEINKLISELDQAKQIIRNLEAKYTFDDIIGSSEVMVATIAKARLAAETPATIILRGESGTGKELFAHAIHNASDRKFNQFVRVNCAAISENILESELFGYVEGAFTGASKGGKIGLFEQADGGTIFLDEIGEISLTMQAKLLRVLQEKEIVRVGGTKPMTVDVRVISATNVDLEKAVSERKFRKDLYYRLNVFPIQIPALRSHKDDLSALIEFLINKYNQEYGRHVRGINDSAMAHIRSYDWPGNVRELENYIGRSMINMRMSETILERYHMPSFQSGKEGSDSIAEDMYTYPQRAEMQRTLSDHLEMAEKSHILHVLRENDDNRELTAKDLEISLRSLYYKLKKYGIH